MKIKTTEELQAYNEVLEQSSEYQRILPKVMKEVYTLFVKERIESLERLAETEEVGNEQLADDLPWEPMEQRAQSQVYLNYVES